VAVPVGAETADRIIAALKPRVEKLKVGPASDKASEMGPVITKASQERIKNLISSGVSQGAELVLDGRDFSLQGYENGYFVGPTLFDRVTPQMDIYKEEVFGPVLSVVRSGTYEEALQLVMDNPYGNGTAIFTRDGDAGHGGRQCARAGAAGLSQLRRLEGERLWRPQPAWHGLDKVLDTDQDGHGALAERHQGRRGAENANHGIRPRDCMGA
jgi:malonate-semialdehyde dehydrogenase (acetylating)/methylmalonate-semialdehyde dehydrogenase